MPEPRQDLGTLLDWAAALADRRGAHETAQWTDLSESDREGVEVLRAIARLADRTSPPGPGTAPAIGHWGGYELLTRVGEGAFGEVYRAYDPRLDRLVAIKLRQPHRAESAEDRERMLAEGRLLARVDHPHIVRVIAAEEHENRFGLVMSWVGGESLDRTLEDGPLPVDETLRIGADLGAALTQLHQRRILHRDVKAENVIRQTDGSVVLVDLGIGVETHRLVGSGSLSGTPLYMAPELWSGEPPSPRSDLYGLGVLLYYLLCGRFPVQADTVRDLSLPLRRSDPVPLERVRSGLPRPLYRLVATCLAERPGDRPSSAAEVVAVCRRLLRRRVRVARLAAAWTLGALLLGLAGLWLYTGSRAADVTTRSTVARRFYGAAELVNARGIQSAALFCALRATELDPSFASAYALAAVAARGQGRNELATGLASTARELAGQATEPGEAEGIEVSVALVTFDYEAAFRAGRALAEIRPDATVQLRQVTQAAMRLGRFEEALAIQRRVVASSPEVAELGTLLDPLFSLGRWDRVSRLLDRWESERPHEPYLLWQRGAYRLATGDARGAAAAFRRLADAADPDLAEVGRAWLDELEATRAWRQGRPPPQEPVLSSSHWHQRACLLRLAAVPSGQAPATCLERLTSDSDPAWYRALGRLAAEAGDRATLAAVIELLDQRRTGHHPPVLDVAALQLTALDEGMKSRFDRAVGLLDEAERRWWPDLELALSRRQLLRQHEREDELALLTASLRDRCGEFLVAGLWFEFLRLGEERCPQLDRASIGTASRHGEKHRAAAVISNGGTSAPR